MRFDLPQIKTSKNLVLACHITGVYDVNRNTTLAHDDYELVREWAESLAAAQVQGILFHNNFSDLTCLKYSNDYLTFIKIDGHPSYNPNVFRYFVYRDFLEKNLSQLNHVFCTDVSDVVLVKNPFTDSFLLENKQTIFCGDEPKVLQNEWMFDHGTHLREKIQDYAAFEVAFANETLLNCGIIGANAPLFYQFIQQLCAFHELGNRDNKTAFTGDMGVFNFVARTQFNAQLMHGKPVNTVFKNYETERTDCWFRHK
ncbi:MAG: hypothetical protein RL699_781 [Bacteroidota bacterium]|jgi:hypothetical protein